MTPDTHHPLAQPGLPQRSDRPPDPPDVITHWLATAHPIPRRGRALVGLREAGLVVPF
ncbi:hypothetical protein [Streptomyces sp. NBC_00005]|uniref:hypothetical protein n=1 Tax=Streptomyces sp. NBC_00005 TaxID=2903609 RepID=UPI00325007FA